MYEHTILYIDRRGQQKLKDIYKVSQKNALSELPSKAASCQSLAWWPGIDPLFWKQQIEEILKVRFFGTQISQMGFSSFML